MAEEDVDTDRTAVKTYVPAYQKAEWQAHAADLDMSQSEFVRTMVQAGRREFAIDPEEPDVSDSNPGGQNLEDRIIDILRREGPQSWEDLLAAVTAGIEDRLDETMEALQERDQVRYSGRKGGYTFAGEK